MKMIMKSAVVAGVGILAVTTMLAKGHNTNPVHTSRFSARVTFINPTSGTNSTGGATATGSLSSSINSRNNTDHESFTLRARGLTPSTPYSVIATEFETNQLDIGDFTSDKNGNGRLSSRNTGNTKHPAAIPAGLELFNVTELDLVDDSNTNTDGTAVTVLTADATSPTTFSFTSTQTQTGTNGETGTLIIRGANRRGTTLSLNAAGLNPGTDFILSLVGNSGTNSVGTNSSTFTSDTNGNLRINNAPVSNILGVTEVDLLDTSEGNFPVLVFPLP